MVAKMIVEKFKKHEREVGMRIGREKGRQEGREVGRQEGLLEVRQQWQAWYDRQQAAQRAGQPFTELPPGYSDNGGGNKSL